MGRPIVPRQEWANFRVGVAMFYDASGSYSLFLYHPANMLLVYNPLEPLRDHVALPELMFPQNLPDDPHHFSIHSHGQSYSIVCVCVIEFEPIFDVHSSVVCHVYSSVVGRWVLYGSEFVSHDSLRHRNLDTSISLVHDGILGARLVDQHQFVTYMPLPPPPEFTALYQLQRMSGRVVNGVLYVSVRRPGNPALHLQQSVYIFRYDMVLGQWLPHFRYPYPPIDGQNHSLREAFTNRLTLIFTSELGESIHSYYLRFTKLINDMKMIPITMSPMQINTKFVNHLQPEWSRFVIAAKQARDLHSVNFNQLYAFLKHNEKDANMPI
ncbi:hypothetical protein Tco_0991397 [Tanacetum coccineum]|uniref:Uncharacterized protein n=1 Tax=Tanacetum coccineum TaxID=301880 RepID=A0ABQ5EZY5_9ASTR